LHLVRRWLVVDCWVNLPRVTALVVAVDPDKVSNQVRVTGESVA
jgi:hypothetical protein